MHEKDCTSSAGNDLPGSIAFRRIYSRSLAMLAVPIAIGVFAFVDQRHFGLSTIALYLLEGALIPFSLLATIGLLLSAYKLSFTGEGVVSHHIFQDRVIRWREMERPRLKEIILDEDGRKMISCSLLPSFDSSKITALGHFLAWDKELNIRPEVYGETCESMLKTTTAFWERAQTGPAKIS